MTFFQFRSKEKDIGSQEIEKVKIKTPKGFGRGTGKSFQGEFHKSSKDGYIDDIIKKYQSSIFEYTAFYYFD